MLLSLAIWLQNLEFFAYLRSSGYAFPAILAMHLSAISLFGSMIVATDCACWDGLSAAVSSPP